MRPPLLAAAVTPLRDGGDALDDDAIAPLVAYLEPIQARYKDFSSDPGGVAKILEAGAEKAQSIASNTLATVYDRVGFLPRLG